MFGLIGKMLAAPGKREELLTVMLSDISDMPGCLSYVLAKDLEDPDAIWVTEVWVNEESHKASLSLPAVQATIAKARPLIAGFDAITKVEPIGGLGLRTTS